MNKVAEMVDAQERFYILQDEAARARNPRKAVRRRPRKDLGIGALEADIHPCCQRCGERIDNSMCESDACASLCSRCAAAEGKL